MYSGSFNESVLESGGDTTCKPNHVDSRAVIYKVTEAIEGNELSFSEWADYFNLMAECWENLGKRGTVRDLGGKVVKFGNVLCKVHHDGKITFEVITSKLCNSDVRCDSDVSCVVALVVVHAAALTTTSL